MIHIKDSEGLRGPKLALLPVPSLSVSTCSAFGKSGQLSNEFGTPSPSLKEDLDQSRAQQRCMEVEIDSKG